MAGGVGVWVAVGVGCMGVLAGLAPAEALLTGVLMAFTGGVGWASRYPNPCAPGG